MTTTIRLSLARDGSGWFEKTGVPNKGFPAGITPRDLLAMQAAFDALQALTSATAALEAATSAITHAATDILSQTDIDLQMAVELRLIAQLLEEQRPRPRCDLDKMRQEIAIEVGRNEMLP